jgi:hypothetical protein
VASPTPRRSAAGIFQRIFEEGLVLVNPTKAAITVALKDTMHLVTLARPVQAVILLDRTLISHPKALRIHQRWTAE